jgi:hypothetical protein
MDLPDQAMTVQMMFEDVLEEGESVSGVHGVEAEAGPGLSRALHHERTRLGVDPVGVSPQPSMARLDKGPGESVEYLVRPQPYVLVAAEAHIGLEAPGFEPGAAVHPIAGRDEIGLRQLGRGGHFLLELNTHTQVLGPLGQDVEQVLAPDAVTAAPVVQHLLAVDVDEFLLPDRCGLLDCPGRNRVASVEVGQDVVPEHDAPALGRAGCAAFEDGDVVPRILQLHQKREVEAGRAATHADDPHRFPPSERPRSSPWSVRGTACPPSRYHVRTWSDDH